MSSRPVVLLTGASGQVGWELRRCLMPLAKVVAPGREHFDLARPETLIPLIRQLKPRWIVNPAAYTAVDRAESERDLCYAVNALAPGVLAEAAREVGAGIVHFSTDYVFDGRKNTPYREEDLTAPLNWYGASKLAGEQAVADAADAWLVFRTAWVYGAHGANFVRTMMRLLRERSTLTVVDDQIGTPTWARAIAEAVATVLARCPDPQQLGSRKGVYHLTCGGQTTWFAFAAAIHDRLQARGVAPLAELQPIPSQAYPTPAKRSPYSVLDNGKLEQAFDIRLPDWDEVFSLAAPEFGL